MKRILFTIALLLVSNYIYGKQQSKIKFLKPVEGNEVEVSFGFEKMSIVLNKEQEVVIEHDEPIIVVFEKFSNRYIYLEPGYNLMVDNENNQWTFQGTGEKENTYLSTFQKKRAVFNSEVPFVTCLDMQPEMFYQLIRKHKNIFDNLIREYSLESNQLFLNHIDYTIAKRVVHYQKENSLDTSNQYSLTKKTLYPLNHIDINHQESLCLPFGIYQDILEMHFIKQTRGNRNNLLDFNNQIQIEAINSIKNSEVKNQFLYNYTIKCLRFIPNKKDVFYSTFLSANSNIELKSKMDQYYFESEKIGKGQSLPDFNFKTLDGKLYKKHNVLGSITYIDIWATYCKPCIADFKKLKELESKYRGQINFVSVIYKDSSERLKNWIKNKNPEWTQLIGDVNDPFFENMKVSGVPRYILVDEQGYIISPSANNPRSIENELTKLLK